LGALIQDLGRLQARIEYLRNRPFVGNLIEKVDEKAQTTKAAFGIVLGYVLPETGKTGSGRKDQAVALT